MNPNIAYTTPEAPIPVLPEMANWAPELTIAAMRKKPIQFSRPIAGSNKPPRIQSQ
jgi:hypothetical protein